MKRKSLNLLAGVIAITTMQFVLAIDADSGAGKAGGQAVAAEAVAKAAVEAANGVAKPEQIIVTGQMSERELRVATVRALEKIYQIYSRLNDDRLYDVVCEDDKRTGTLLGQVRCTPRFYNMLMRNYGEAINIPQSELQARKDELDRRLKLYVQQSQQLRDAVLEYNRLNQQLPVPTAAGN
ncbi:MAG TPA: hypothetical protein VMH83_13395 [Candidatus Acidoferrum sp.]|nr:hypothetical protein [Candidatus Acidoferrum sp.]